MATNDDDQARQPLSIGFQLADDALDDYDDAGRFAEAFCADVADFLQGQGVHLDVWQCSADLVFGVFCFKLGPANVMLTMRRYEDVPDGEEWWLHFQLTPDFPSVPDEHRDALVLIFVALLGALHNDGRISLLKATLPPGVTVHEGGHA